MKLKIFAFLLPLFLLCAGYFSVSAQQAPKAQTANYIVVFKDQVANPGKEATDITSAHLGSLKHTYNHALKGFSGSFAPSEIEKIKKDSRVKFVSEDKTIKIAQTVTCQMADVDHDNHVTILDLSAIAKYFGNTVALVPAAAPYDLDGDGTVSILDLSAAAKYFGQTCVVPTPTPTPSPSPTPTPTPTPVSTQVVSNGLMRVGGQNANNKGTGIGVAVLDTGINLSHPDLAPNIVANTSCVPNVVSGNDDNGHGTQVAGIIAAQDNTIGVVGVAPEAKLIAVKVFDLNGSASWSQVICGIDWITANAQTYNIKVANMSFTGTGTNDNNCGNTNSDALHLAICNSLAQSGVVYVAAAGNNTIDTTNVIPASYDDSVIAVSALADSDGQAGGLGTSTQFGPDDTFASFSNFGTGVDIGAPGANIYTTNGTVGYITNSGTSFAAPFVSGAGALYIHSHPGATFSQVRTGLISAGEVLGSGHTDPSGKHPEPVLKIGSL